MTSIDRVLSYVSSLDGQFRPSIAGASDREIGLLEMAAGRPMPSIYRAFLRHFGRGMGWLSLNRARCQVSAVTKFYLDAGHRDLPERFFVIGIAPAEPFFHLHLESRPGREPRVVAFPHVGGTLEQILSADLLEIGATLPEALCADAFATARMSRFPVRKAFVERSVQSSRLGPAAAVVDRMQGFQQLWFSTDSGLYYLREDCALRITSRPRTPLSISIAAAGAGMAEAARLAFASQFELAEALA